MPPIFYLSLACLYTQHAMIIVKTSHRNFDNITQNFNKNSCGEFIHLKNPQKVSQKFKTTRTHYFINQRSYLNISAIN